METINLSIDLVNGILQYLGTRPFNEVVGLINEIQKQANEQANTKVQQEIEPKE